MTDHPLKEIACLVASQDNACTADPIPTVQKEQVIYGVDLNYTDDYCWSDSHGDIVTDRDIIKVLEICNLKNFSTLPYRKVGVIRQWVHVETFFTISAAEEFIAQNSGRGEHLRIYMGSGHRNSEMRMIRSYLLEVAKETQDA